MGKKKKAGQDLRKILLAVAALLTGIGALLTGIAEIIRALAKG